ncbi:unnamed protein product [Brassicogethes aeneus]|uniref:SUEL-type lectin domain-containing protein n=1 Tax=Brassicogethes aeneus TaxID=1431903 RepID=A0A9P0FGF7_BRAAE|nr:unnamed protein product [Brassicogethes aeneus]
MYISYIYPALYKLQNIVNFWVEIKMDIPLILLLLGLVFNLTKALQLGTCANSSRIYSKFSCENKPLTLSCPKDTVIKISSAQYGRTKTSICPGNMPNQTCKAPSSKRLVSEACSGKNECTIAASNTVFGDPCPTTEKYLEVNYCCETPYPVGCDTAPQVETACGSTFLSLKCQVGKLNILSANYGRTDTITCPYGTIQTTNCHADNSTSIVSKWCNGKSECYTLAHPYIFGDPCNGTFKYLFAKFCCKLDE